MLYVIYYTPGEYIYEHPVSDDRWKKDEILAAKIKKFLSVSLMVLGYVNIVVYYFVVHIGTCISFGLLNVIDFKSCIIDCSMFMRGTFINI